MLLKPILSSMRRFPRPMIMHDPFRDQPPMVWSKGAAPAAAPAEGATNQHLRDPRVENNVTHLGYLPRQRRVAMREVAVENRRDDAIDAGGVTVEAKSLYLIRCGEVDGDVRLGLGYVSSLTTVGVHATSEVKQKVLWFVRKSKTSTWGRTVQFKPYTSGRGRRLSDKIDIDAFVLKVEVSDLTSASRRKWRDEPCLSMACVEKAKAIDKSLQQRVAAAEENTDEEVVREDSQAHVDPHLLSLKNGDVVYAEDEYKDWSSARVKEVKVDNNGVVQSCHVHYDGWAAKFDAWIEVNSGRVSLSMPVFSDDEEETADEEGDEDEDNEGDEDKGDEDTGDEDPPVTKAKVPTSKAKPPAPNAKPFKRAKASMAKAPQANPSQKRAKVLKSSLEDEDSCSDPPSDPPSDEGEPEANPSKKGAKATFWG